MLPTTRTPILFGPSRSLAGTPAPTAPSLGAELLANGNMEAGNPPSSWVAGSATLAGAADERTGGAGAQSLDVLNTGAGGNGRGTQVITVSAGAWYRLSGWLRRVVNASPVLRFSNSAESVVYGASPAVSSTSWTAATVIAWASQATGKVWVLNPGGGINDQSRGDDISARPLTLASTLSFVGTTGRRDGTYDAPVTVAAGTQAGLAICVDDHTNPAYMLYAYTDRTNCVLIKRDNGTETQLIATATGVTYAAGRRLRLVVAGTSVSLWYESAAGVFTQIGTTQTVGNIASYGYRLCGFDPSGSNTFGQFQWRAA